MYPIGNGFLIAVKENTRKFFGQVIVDVPAEAVTRSVGASGQVVIPSVNADEIPAGSKTDFRDSKKSLIDNPPKICFNI